MKINEGWGQANEENMKIFRCYSVKKAKNLPLKVKLQGVSNETRFFAVASTHLCYKLGQIGKLVY